MCLHISVMKMHQMCPTLQVKVCEYSECDCQLCQCTEFLVAKFVSNVTHFGVQCVYESAKCRGYIFTNGHKQLGR